MKPIEIPIVIATTFLFIYILFLSLPPLMGYGLILFGISPLVIIWMVYKILKDGEPSKSTFHDSFYEDVFIKTYE